MNRHLIVFYFLLACILLASGNQGRAQGKPAIIQNKKPAARLYLSLILAPT